MQTETKINKRDTDHIYYNVNVTNTTNSNLELSYRQQLGIPLIDNPSDYELSVVRFTLPGIDLPFFKVVYEEGKNGQAVPFLGQDFYVTFVYIDGSGDPYTYQQQLLWVPTGYNPNANPNYDYSYFSIQQVINVINTAMATAWAALVVDFPAITSTPPAFIFQDGLLKLVLPNPAVLFATTKFPPFVGGQVSGTAQIWFSDILWRYLSSFNYYGSGNYYNDYTDVMMDFSGLNLPAGASYTVVSESPNFSNWVSLQQIVITTSTLPVKSESLPQLTTLTNSQNNAYISFNTQGNTQGAGSLFNRPVISDFAFTSTTGFDLFQTLYYNPTAEYRMIDLQGSTPIQTIDFEVFWIDTYGNFNKFIIGPGSKFTVKMLFRRKGVTD